MMTMSTRAPEKFAMFKEGTGTDYRGGEIYMRTLTLDSAGR